MRIRWFSSDGQRIARDFKRFQCAPRSHVDQRRVKAVETLFCLNSCNLKVYFMKRADYLLLLAFVALIYPY